MRRTVKFGNRERLYDTDEATELGRKTYGTFGDPSGYEEVLYQMPSRLYFIYGRGGATSPYPEPEIEPVRKADGLARIA